MKAKVKKATFQKEYETKFGTLFLHKIIYEENGNEFSGYYSSKKKDQNKFVAGQEAEFDVEVQTGRNGVFNKIKPVMQNKGYSNYGRSVQREQSKYSGFAMSYAKDLVVAGVINMEQLYSEAQCMIDWMVQKDKELLK